MKSSLNDHSVTAKLYMESLTKNTVVCQWYLRPVLQVLTSNSFYLTLCLTKLFISSFVWDFVQLATSYAKKSFRYFLSTSLRLFWKDKVSSNVQGLSIEHYTYWMQSYSLHCHYMLLHCHRIISDVVKRLHMLKRKSLHHVTVEAYQLIGKLESLSSYIMLYKTQS